MKFKVMLLLVFNSIKPKIWSVEKKAHQQSFKVSVIYPVLTYMYKPINF